MNKALTVLLFASIPVHAVAQQDTIRWMDGTITDRARVSDFNAFEVRYTVRGVRSQKPSDTVASLNLERVTDAYRRGVSADAPGVILTTARARLSDGDKFVAQFGFLAAARLFLAIGEQEEGFNTLDELKRSIPDSGFLADCYRLKIDYLLESGKEGAAQAEALAVEYRNQTTSLGLPAGFGLEAQFYEIISQFTGGSIDARGMQSGLDNLLIRVRGPYPSLGHKVRLGIGTSQRAQGQVDQAKETFQDLTEKENVEVNTRAGAYLGLGHLELSRGDSGTRDAFREALLNFLRVHEETKGASASIVAESLYFAAEAAQKWNGQDSAFMNRRLKLILASEYPNSPWTNR